MTRYRRSFVIARAASRRPTLQHLMSTLSPIHTACGLLMDGWSRAYQVDAIPEILCVRCDRKMDSQ